MSRLSGVALALVLALLVFLLDQGLKRLVENSMHLGQSIPVISGVLRLTYIKNEGGAFGVLAGHGGLLLAGSVVALAVVLWMLFEGPPSRIGIAGCGLIVGGAAGNLLDRMGAGEVTDYMDLQFWPVFNAADVAIVFGVAILLLTAARPGGKD